MAGKSDRKIRTVMVSGILAAAMLVAGCNAQQVITHGAVISQNQIDLIPVGSSKDQVLLALGTPSTTGTFENEVYYYISQQKQRKFAYQKPKLIDQRVLAVYFDESEIVAEVANYGIQDGKVFDFISRTTPTGGDDLTFLGQILTARPSVKPNAAPPPGGPPSGGVL